MASLEASWEYQLKVRPFHSAPCRALLSDWRATTRMGA